VNRGQVMIAVVRGHCGHGLTASQALLAAVISATGVSRPVRGQA